MKYGLLGERLMHSFSPIIHAYLGDYEYLLYEKKPEEVEDFVLRGDYNGLNVTIPYKQTVVPLCAALSAAARETGSVNTILRLRNGSLYGDNTDVFGFEYLLRKAGSAEGKVLVLGNGGSSRTIQAVLRGMGLRYVVVSRQGEENYQNIHRHRNAALIINTTPVGMYPNNGVSPLKDLSLFDCKVVIDLIYNPSRTELLMDAEDRSISAFNGLAMLAAQAKRAADLFIGEYIPDDKTEAIINKIEKQTKNIVLIGMPGCGKTTVGQMLASMMSRTFHDTDELIERECGRSIPDILLNDGEEAFRKLENAVLESISKESGRVIATGGGIVTRAINRRLIRQNSAAIFLDRDIAQLPVSGRPLSRQMGVEALAGERLPLYRQWADYTVTARGVRETAEDIIKIWEHA